MKASGKAMIYKDIKEVASSKQMIIPMMSVPTILMVIVPIIYLVGANYATSGWNGMDKLMSTLGSQYSNLSNSQLILMIGINYLFPGFFLLIPIMASSIIAASSFIGEKERKTMESLFYTPLTIEELFTAKVIGTFIPAFIVSIISAILFGAIMNIGGLIYFGKFIFPNLKWLVLIFWLTPAVTFLGIYFMVWISAKANTFQEAHQMSMFLVFPIVIVIVGQMSGLFMLSTEALFMIGAAIYALDYILTKNATKKFSPEKLI